jgi:5-oxopent-3-ene-1,2,5-tricarboxylate decarboxylase / 2-hydroxyhepta-2,4-diene-1,7-dioate isomerase
MLSNTAWSSIAIDVPPFRLTGTVYGVLLNHRSAIAVLGDAVNQLPYKAPPRSPVLYIKPRNTLAGPGDPVVIPAGCAELEVAACLGVVIGRTACRIRAADALASVAGYLIVNDVSVPHASYYRPAIREKARDGYCPLGPWVTPRDEIPDPGGIESRTFIDGELVQSASTRDLVRPLGQLLAEVTEFMTLVPGDVLCLGAAAPAPRVRAAQTVTIEMTGLGRLSNRFIAEAP